MGTVLLTGANGSLAVPAVRHLLSTHPSCTAILTVRNTSEQDPNTARLRATIADFPDSKCSIRKLDLASLSAVRSFAQEIHQEVAHGKLSPLIAVICNAMAWSINSGIKYSEDGYEESIAVNHIGHLALTLQLLGDMEKTGRILFLSSEAREPGRAAFETYPPTLPEDLDLLVHPMPDKKGEEAGRGFQRYGLSKLVVIMTMYELQRRLDKSEALKGISVLAMDPGGLLDSRAFWGRGIPAMWKAIITILNWAQPLLKLIKPTLRRSSEASKDLIDLAVDARYAGQNGHFEMRQKADSSPASRNEDLQAELWNKSLEWSKLTQTDTALSL